MRPNRVRSDLPILLTKWSAAAPAALLALAMMASPAEAATQEDYLATCLAVAGETGTELCNCKAEQAGLLVDEVMMDYLIARLQDPQAFSESVKAGDVPQEVVDKWPYYVRDSNAICLAPDEEE